MGSVQSRWGRIPHRSLCSLPWCCQPVAAGSHWSWSCRWQWCCPVLSGLSVLLVWWCLRCQTSRSQSRHRTWCPGGRCTLFFGSWMWFSQGRSGTCQSQYHKSLAIHRPCSWAHTHPCHTCSAIWCRISPKGRPHTRRPVSPVGFLHRRWCSHRGWCHSTDPVDSPRIVQSCCCSTWGKSRRCRCHSRPCRACHQDSCIRMSPGWTPPPASIVNSWAIPPLWHSCSVSASMCTLCPRGRVSTPWILDRSIRPIRRPHTRWCWIPRRGFLWGISPHPCPGSRKPAHSGSLRGCNPRRWPKECSPDWRCWHAESHSRPPGCPLPRGPGTWSKRSPSFPLSMCQLYRIPSAAHHHGCCCPRERPHPANRLFRWAYSPEQWWFYPGLSTARPWSSCSRWFYIPRAAMSYSQGRRSLPFHLLDPRPGRWPSTAAHPQFGPRCLRPDCWLTIVF